MGLFVISLLFARQFFIPSERRLKPYQLSGPPAGTHFGPSALLFLVVCSGRQRPAVRVNKYVLLLPLSDLHHHRIKD